MEKKAPTPIPSDAVYYCGLCKEFRHLNQTYVLLLGEIIDRVCGQWTGVFENDWIGVDEAP